MCFEARATESVATVLKRAMELDEMRSLIGASQSVTVPISSFAITASSTMLFVDPAVPPASPPSGKSGIKALSSPNTHGWHLAWNGKVLKDGRSIGHYHIGENAILDLISTSATVSLQISLVTTSSSRTIELNRASSDLIRDLVSQLEESEGCKIASLQARGRKLKEAKSLGHYHLEGVQITASLADGQRRKGGEKEGEGKREEKEKECLIHSLGGAEGERGEGQES